MQQILNYVYVSVAALFLGELAIGLLPEGGMKKFCKFILGLLLVFMVLGMLRPEAALDFEVSLQPPEQSAAIEAGSYEELILDVYHREMENKNN